MSARQPSPVRLSTTDPRTGQRPERDGTDPYRWAQVEGRLFRVCRGARGWSIHEVYDEGYEPIAAFIGNLTQAAEEIFCYVYNPSPED